MSLAVWEFQQGFIYGSVCLANGGAMMFDLNHKFKVIFNKFLFFISFICLAALTACGGSSSSDGIDEILGDDFSDTALTLSGRVIKGVLENANVSIYHVINGEISQIPVKSSITDINGSYEIITPGGAMFEISDTNGFSGIIYVEATPSNDPLQPTLMTCDAISGCGVKNDIVINFGDTFPVNKDFKLRGYAIVDLKSTHSSTQLTPWSHIVVAYAENLPGGLTISNINQANTFFSELFLFTQSVNTINAIDLTVINEIDEASDYGVTAAIITSSLLNIGQSPNFLNIETVLSTLTTQGGLLLNNDSDDPERLSFLNIARQSLNNIPNHLSDRPNIETHLNKIYEKALNSTNDIEIDIVSGSDGNIISSSHNFECSEICQYNISKDEIITLNAIADNGFEFTSWNGTCPGLIDQSYPVCEFNVTKPTNVQAEFSPLNKITHNLIITIVGAGLVNLDNEGFTCNTNCVFTLDDNALIDLSALPSIGYHIETWDLDNNSVCGTSLKCEVIMLEDHNLHIVFKEDAPPPVEFVTLSVQNNGPGIVTDSGLNLECQQADCLFQIEKGSTVHFTARPMDNLKYEFTGWQGLCSGSGSCIRTLNSNDTLTANFSALPKQTINFGVSEGGSVIDTVLNISCTQITCSNDLDFGTQVNLKAIANNGYTFDHWENDCTNFNDVCSLTMNSGHTVKAVFKIIGSSTTVSWAPPTQRENGDELSLPEIKKYIIYYGVESGVYIDAIEVGFSVDINKVPTSLVIEGLTSGVDYYFAGMTVDTNNISSYLSNEIIRMID